MMGEWLRKTSIQSAYLQDNNRINSTTYKCKMQIQRNGKELNRYFPKEDMQSMTRYAGEMLVITNHLRSVSQNLYHRTLLRMAITKAKESKHY